MNTGASPRVHRAPWLGAEVVRAPINGCASPHHRIVGGSMEKGKCGARQSARSRCFCHRARAARRALSRRSSTDNFRALALPPRRPSAAALGSFRRATASTILGLHGATQSCCFRLDSVRGATHSVTWRFAEAASVHATGPREGREWPPVSAPAPQDVVLPCPGGHMMATMDGGWGAPCDRR